MMLVEREGPPVFSHISGLQPVEDSAGVVPLACHLLPDMVEYKKTLLEDTQWLKQSQQH